MNRTLALGLFAALTLTTGCSTIRNVSVQSEPEGADIYVDGDKVGAAPLTYGFDFAEPKTYTVTAKREGYVDGFVKVSEIYLDATGDKVKLKVEEDESWTGTAPAEGTNDWMNVDTNPRLDTAQVWQLMVDTVTKYYPKLAQLDPDAGYIASEEKIQTFHRGLENTKVRNQFFCSIATRKPLVYKIKIESAILEQGKWETFPRIFKEDTALITELQTRLSE